MVTDNSHIISPITNNFNIALIIFGISFSVKLPFYRFESHVKAKDIPGPKLITGIFLGIANAAILKWCENGGRNIDIIHLST